MNKFIAFLFLIGVAIAIKKTPIEQKIKEVNSKYKKQWSEYSVVSSSPSNSIQERQTGTPTILINGQAATGTLNPFSSIDFVFSYDNSSFVPVWLLVATNNDASLSISGPTPFVPSSTVFILANVPFNQSVSVSCSNTYFFRLVASATTVTYSITATAAPGTNDLIIGGPTLRRSTLGYRAILRVTITQPCSNFTVIFGNFPVGASNNYLYLQPFCDPTTVTTCPVSNDFDLNTASITTLDAANLFVTCVPAGTYFVTASTSFDGDFDMRAVSGYGCQNCPIDKAICKVDGTCSCYQPFSGQGCSVNSALPVPDVGNITAPFSVYHSFQAPTLTSDNLIISIELDQFSFNQVEVIITRGSSPDITEVTPPLVREYIYSSSSFEFCSGMASNSLFVIRLSSSGSVSYGVNVSYVNRVVATFPFSFTGIRGSFDPPVQFFKIANIPPAIRAGLTINGPIGYQPQGIAIVSAQECAFLAGSYISQTPRRSDFSRHRNSFAISDSCGTDTDLYVAVLSPFLATSFSLLLNSGIGNCPGNCRGNGFCMNDNTCQCYREYNGIDCGFVSVPTFSLNENVTGTGYTMEDEQFFSLDAITNGWDYLKLDGNFGQYGSAQLVADPYDDDGDSSAYLQEEGSDIICSYATGVSRPNNWWVRVRSVANFTFSVSKATPVVLTSGVWLNTTRLRGEALFVSFPLTNTQSATVTIESTDSLYFRTAADGSCDNYRNINSGISSWTIPTCKSNWGSYLYKFSSSNFPLTDLMTIAIKVDISNSVAGCPNCCSGKGACDGTSCVCSPGWQGADCSQPTCVNNLVTCGDGFPKTLIPVFIPNDYDSNGENYFWSRCSLSDFDNAVAALSTETTEPQCANALTSTYCQTYFAYCVSTNVYGIKCDYCSQLTSSCGGTCQSGVEPDRLCTEIDTALVSTRLNFTCFNSSRPVTTGTITTGQGVTTGRITSGRLTTGLVTTGQLPCTRNCGVNQTCVYVFGTQTCQCIPPLVVDPIDPTRCKTSCNNNPQICGQFASCNNGDCFCYNGYQRNIDTGVCEIIPPPPQSSASCSFSGDPHFNGFGGFPYDYHGGCDYVAVRGGNLEVQTRLEFCNFQQTISCAAAAAVWIKDVNVTVVVKVPYDIWVNNVPTTVTTSLSLGGGHSIQRYDAYSVTVRLADGSQINFQSYYYSIIIPRPIYYQAVSGLCGNWDSTTPNLLHHRDGNVTNYSTLPPSWSPVVSAFGDSWIVAQSKGDRYLLEPLGAPRCPAKKRQAPNPCDQNTLTWAREQCAVLLQNPSCTAINLNAYYENCVFDVCTTESLEWVDISRNVVEGACAWYSNATATDVTTGTVSLMTTGDQTPPPEVSEASFIAALCSMMLLVLTLL